MGLWKKLKHHFSIGKKFAEAGEGTDSRSARAAYKAGRKSAKAQDAVSKERQRAKQDKARRKEVDKELSELEDLRKDISQEVRQLRRQNELSKQERERLEKLDDEWRDITKEQKELQKKRHEHTRRARAREKAHNTKEKARESRPAQWRREQKERKEKAELRRKNREMLKEEYNELFAKMEDVERSVTEAERKRFRELEEDLKRNRELAEKHEEEYKKNRARNKGWRKAKEKASDTRPGKWHGQQKERKEAAQMSREMRQEMMDEYKDLLAKMEDVERSVTEEERQRFKKLEEDMKHLRRNEQELKEEYEQDRAHRKAGRKTKKEAKKTAGGLRNVITGDAHGSFREHFQRKAQKRNQARAESAQAAAQAAASSRYLRRIYDETVGKTIEDKFYEPLWELYTSTLGQLYRYGPKLSWAEKKEVERYVYNYWDGSPLEQEEKELEEGIYNIYKHFAGMNSFPSNRHGHLLDFLAENYYPTLAERVKFALKCRVPFLRDTVSDTESLVGGRRGPSPESGKQKTAAMFWAIVFFNAAVSVIGSLSGPAGLILDPANMTFGMMSAFAAYFAGTKWYAEYGLWLPVMGRESLVSAISSAGMYILWITVAFQLVGMVPVINTAVDTSWLQMTVYDAIPVGEILGFLGLNMTMGFSPDQFALLALMVAFAMWSGYHLWFGGVLLFMVVFGGPATAVADLKGILDFVGNLQLLLGMGDILYNMTQSATGWMNILGALGVVGGLNVYYGEYEEFEETKEKEGDLVVNMLKEIRDHQRGH